MKQTLIRALLFVLFLLVLYSLVKQPMHEAILNALVATYIFEGAVTQLLNRP